MKKVLILFGTLTDNTRGVAAALKEALAGEMPEVSFELYNVRHIRPEQLGGFDLVLFGAPTWDHGIPDPDTEEFLLGLSKTAADLSGKTFALFGLGDSSYPHFCEALPILRQALRERGAAVSTDEFTIDGFPNDEHAAALAQWARGQVRV